MPSDKEILYNIIDREVDNMLRGMPVISIFSGTVKGYIHNFLDPYVNFFMEGDDLKIEMASAFVNEEMSSKLENFKKNFKEIKEETDNE